MIAIPRLRRALALLTCLAGLASAQVDSPRTQSRVRNSNSQLPLSTAQRQEVQSALASGDYKRAETILVAQIDKNPTSDILLLFTARIFLRDKDPVNAAIAFKKAEKLRPLEAPDRFSMAMAFLGVGRPKWARPELLALLREDPENTKYQYWLARMDYDEHQYEAAIQRLRLVTAATPSFVRGWDTLGLCFEGAGRLDEAVESYKQAVDVNRTEKPPSPWPPLNYGILLTKMAKLEEGENLLREALRYDSHLAPAHLKLGVNLQRQSRKEEAIRELRQAADLAPTDPRPFYSLSQLYRDSGDEAAAEAAAARYRELKKTSSGDPAAASLSPEAPP